MSSHRFQSGSHFLNSRWDLLQMAWPPPILAAPALTHSPSVSQFVPATAERSNWSLHRSRSSCSQLLVAVPSTWTALYVVDTRLNPTPSLRPRLSILLSPSFPLLPFSNTVPHSSVFPLHVAAPCHHLMSYYSIIMYACACLLCQLGMRWEWSTQSTEAWERASYLCTEARESAHTEGEKQGKRKNDKQRADSHGRLLWIQIQASC